jgi:hypothetical protein
MSDAQDPVPTSTLLCGTFPDPAVRDTGRSYSAAISPGCEAPTVTVDGNAEIVYVNGEPIALENE